jgi:hypothetical protein
MAEPKNSWFNPRVASILPDITDLTACEGSIVEEYKLLQGKIDKIGEFKYHIKNWGFTLTLAILAGGLAAGLEGWVLFVAAIAPAAAFCGLEWGQDRLINTFGGRAKELEGISVKLADMRARILLRDGKEIPAMAAFGIAQAVTASPAPFWLKPNTFAYLIMIGLAAAASFGGHFNKQSAKQNISGSLSVDVLTWTRSETLPPLPKWNLVAPPLWHANVTDCDGVKHDANGNILP